MPDVFEGYLKQLEHAPPYELGFVGAEAEWLQKARPKQILPITFKKALLLTGRGFGKDYCCNTPVLTSRGWKTNGALLVGDKLYDERGQLCRVQEVHPVSTNSRCFKVCFSDGSHIIAGADHLWCALLHEGTVQELAAAVPRTTLELFASSAIHVIPCNVGGRTRHHYITGIEPTPTVPIRCITVDSPSGLFLAGRSMIPTHNTLTAASWCRRQAGMYPGSIGHVIAPTFADLYGTTFEGETGLLKVIPETMIDSIKYSPYPLLRLINGSIIRGFSAEKPARLRGPQSHYTWGDETAVWQYYDEMMHNIEFSTRLVYERKDGKGNLLERIQPQHVFTTTPQPIEQLREMAEDPKVFQVRGSLYENKDNLAETFIEDILKHEGTKLGEQEIYGIILNFDDSAIIKKRWLRMWPKDRQLPQFQLVYVSFDTALTEETYNTKTRQADYTACTVWGVFLHEHRMNVMLLNAWHERLGFPDLIERARQEMRTEYGYVEPIAFKTYAGKEPEAPRLAIKPKLMIIEDKGSGISLRQTLEKEKVPMWPYNPGRASKLERLNSIAYTVKGGKKDGRGRVWLIEGDSSTIDKPAFVDWSSPFLAEVCIYNGPGSTRDDDFVDSFSQGMRYFADQFIAAPVSEKLSKPKPKRLPMVNPYGG